jgi:hypothetical protein
MNLSLAFGAIVSLSACMGGQQVRELPGGGTLAITSVATLEADANLIQRFDANGQELASQLTTGESVMGDTVRATVPAVVNTLTGGVVAAALGNTGCGNSCGGPTFNIAGGAGGNAQAVAGSETTTNVGVAVGTCPAPRADGTCPPPP